MIAIVMKMKEISEYKKVQEINSANILFLKCMRNVRLFLHLLLYLLKNFLYSEFQQKHFFLGGSNIIEFCMMYDTKAVTIIIT